MHLYHMDDGSTNSNSYAASGKTVEHNLDSLLSQLEGQWDKAAELIMRLSEENSFLQERLRDLEEQLGDLDMQLQEAKQRTKVS
ncbi:MAG: hypothetical protein HW380_1487 [Magnetococcales bacterium]|nr:hypothetical protein [Magnetococcales bacterium]HIJ83562.1 hypothetical protein [Magnetococcales bacterium]